MLNFEISKKVRFIEERTVREAVAAFSRISQIKRGDFSLAIVGVKEMSKINKLYRGRDRVTDVLSFAEADVSDPADRDRNYLGEIIICWPQAKKQAQELGVTKLNELSRLLVHGLAHLIGYEHEGVSARVAQKMLVFEQRVLKQISRLLGQRG